MPSSQVITLIYNKLSHTRCFK